ncbi:hypothetical protein CONPUDRAFT_114293 [Coniophora puteana RWD-64-598 SS2]|uniref:Xylosidase arabinosidase n=1 Tax=Coniophora puteana (strain RWD-64-598) TaxID=741705 RepID=A0A5M3N415_CONPW|nr:uncharacterized protein CONPUDRAFT_114293 [Coniophora puteana RWD-64-598 SS2]EIW86172.1 hypothetical protein CONPUDRAFT_114293 [Coniophora puteana RWD-64-598 SS2]
MSSTLTPAHAGQLLRANPNTIKNKFMVGYQGWFTCAGDGEPIGKGHHGWLHWLDRPLEHGGRPSIDLWPDVSDCAPSELYPVPGLKLADGSQAYLWSSRNPKTVQRHFHYMAQHGIDGVFLQRFLNQVDTTRQPPGIKRLRDEVGRVVRDAAEKEGRTFSIMYDVSGVPPERLLDLITEDWNFLVRTECILDSPNYLREGGRPVIGLWGFGLINRPNTPALARAVMAHLRSATPGGAYLMMGVATRWRLSEGDAQADPEWLRIFAEEADGISPWLVGRMRDEASAENHWATFGKADLEFLKGREREAGRKVDYWGAVLPGGSAHNLSKGREQVNQRKRNGGRYLWAQVAGMRRAGVELFYGTMWDEYDEGTNFLPIVSHSSQLPVHDEFPFAAGDADGETLPGDWYMRCAGLAGELLRGERELGDGKFPMKDLIDYWSSRPRYEEKAGWSGDGDEGGAAGEASGSGSGNKDGGSGASAHDWQSFKLPGEGAGEEDAPPPYIEYEDPDASTPAASATPPASAAPPLPPRQPSIPGRQSRPAPPVHHTSRPPSVSVSPPPPNVGTRLGPTIVDPRDEDNAPLAELSAQFARQRVSSFGGSGSAARPGSLNYGSSEKMSMPMPAVQLSPSPSLSSRPGTGGSGTCPNPQVAGPAALGRAHSASASYAGPGGSGGGFHMPGGSGQPPHVAQGSRPSLSPAQASGPLPAPGSPHHHHHHHSHSHSHSHSPSRSHPSSPYMGPAQGAQAPPLAPRPSGSPQPQPQSPYQPYQPPFGPPSGPQGPHSPHATCDAAAGPPFAPPPGSPHGHHHAVHHQSSLDGSFAPPSGPPPGPPSGHHDHSGAHHQGSHDGSWYQPAPQQQPQQHQQHQQQPSQYPHQQYHSPPHSPPVQGPPGGGGWGAYPGGGVPQQAPWQQQQQQPHGYQPQYGPPPNVPPRADAYYPPQQQQQQQNWGRPPAHPQSSGSYQQYQYQQQQQPQYQGPHGNQGQGNSLVDALPQELKGLANSASKLLSKFK